MASDRGPKTSCPKIGFRILVSDLAGHAQNLDRTQQCSVLVIRDEQDATQVYVRERLLV